IQIDHLRQRLNERHLTLELTDAAKNLIIEEGYDAAFGARPLKRVLQQKIADPLAVQILEGKIFDGERIVVDAVNGEIYISAMEVLEA
ncbi:MAG: hypothetical protein KDE47_27345, partial [Caldilineaceae bacterium]|nr:hypothetical protein [Caldilineaceae bacterium]